MKKLQCPCCGNYTINSEDEIIVDICEVCLWQYDEIAHLYPQRSIGANKISLQEARYNFRTYGVSKLRFIDRGLTRKPLNEELPENNKPLIK